MPNQCKQQKNLQNPLKEFLEASSMFKTKRVRDIYLMSV